jgi:hypothetical protein
MSNERIQAHLDHLINIGRKSIEEMTQFEMQHFAGLLMNKEYPEKDQDIQALSDYLISNDAEDEKILLTTIKLTCIDQYKEKISDMLNKKLSEAVNDGA